MNKPVILSEDAFRIIACGSAQLPTEDVTSIARSLQLFRATQQQILHSLCS